MVSPRAHWYLGYVLDVEDKDDDFLAQSPFPFVPLNRKALNSALRRITLEMSTLKVYSGDEFRVYLANGGNIILDTRPLPRDDFDYFMEFTARGLVPDLRIRLVHAESLGIENLAKAAQLPYDLKKVASSTSKRKFRYLAQ